jgi:hypothetical protein
VVEDAGAAGLGQELGPEADQAAGRDEVLHAHPAGAVVHHLLHAALAQRDQLRDDAEVVLGDVDGQPLDRLVDLAVDDARHDLRLAHGELEALAPHHLDEHGELQLAAPLDLPGVGTLRCPLTRIETLPTALGRAGRGPWRPVSSWSRSCGEGRGVYADGHRQGRSSTVMTGSGTGVLGPVGEGSRDGDVRDAGDGDDLAGPASAAPRRVGDSGHVELGDLAGESPVRAAPGDVRLCGSLRVHAAGARGGQT